MSDSSVQSSARAGVPAIVVTATGGPEVLVPGEIVVPATGPDQVRIAVAAAGVNFIDVYRRTGLYPVPLPNVPGSEGSGRIVEVGERVTESTGLTVGDRVAWADAPGSYAAEVIAAAQVLIPVPDEVDDLTAAALPLQGLTAHYLATDCHPIAPGETVLVHAGAGGVGLLLTQIAVLRGARVVTTVSTPAKAELSWEAGAHEVLVGYGDFATRVREITDGQGAAAVYDGVGRDTFDASLESVAVRGDLVLFGGSSGPVPPVDPQRLNRAGSVTLQRPTLAHFTRTRQELLDRGRDLLAWVAQGRLQVRVGARYPLADAARAHADLTGRRTTGKVLLVP